MKHYNSFVPQFQASRLSFAVQEFLNVMSDYSYEILSENSDERYFIALSSAEVFGFNDIQYYISLLIHADILSKMPLDPYIVFVLSADLETKILTPTVAENHVRLPQIKYLSTLSVDDFFNFFKLLASGTRTNELKASLRLDPSIIGAPSIEFSSLGGFFTKVVKHYVLDSSYCSSYWISNADIAWLASLDPTPEIMLAAISYLTFISDDDIEQFPTENCVVLDLDWHEIRGGYSIPPYAVADRGF